jgi:hypothetical protein
MHNAIAQHRHASSSRMPRRLQRIAHAAPTNATRGIINTPANSSIPSIIMITPPLVWSGNANHIEASVLSGYGLNAAKKYPINLNKNKNGYLWHHLSFGYTLLLSLSPERHSTFTFIRHPSCVIPT